MDTFNQKNKVFFFLYCGPSFKTATLFSSPDASIAPVRGRPQPHTILQEHLVARAEGHSLPLRRCAGQGLLLQSAAEKADRGLPTKPGPGAGSPCPPHREPRSSLITLTLKTALANRERSSHR